MSNKPEDSTTPVTSPPTLPTHDGSTPPPGAAAAAAAVNSSSTPGTPTASSTQDRAVHFDSPSPAGSSGGPVASQSREHLVGEKSMHNQSPQPYNPGYPPYNNNYYNGGYPPQQPYPYYGQPPLVQQHIVPVNVAYRPEGRRWPAVFTNITALAMLGIMIFELVYNKQVTGNVIETSPFNIMIGPASETLILSGARYVPCMHTTAGYTMDGPYLCPNMTDYGQTGVTAPTLMPTRVNASTVGVECSLQEICGMSTFKSPDYPDQWYRFPTAIFLHSGVVHFMFNMIAHLSLGASMERLLNPFFYAIFWLASGSFGFIFGGVLAPVGNVSVGCSGALFGVVALLFIDLFATWKYVMYPGWELTKLIFLMLLSFVFGLLPGLDNFAHIGGFICGLVAGTIFYPIRTSSRTSMVIMWIVRLVLLGGLVGMFYGMIQLFYSGRSPNEICSWCKYLACLPISNMCDPYNG